MPDIDEIKTVIQEYKPNAMVIIPYDNPTGHFLDTKLMLELSQLCTENNMWIISDEAYRELHYVDHAPVSIWGITEGMVPGITGRRISIETSSKVWNACGLRIGALVTDNADFHKRSVAENTASLCPNAIGQYIFGSLAHVSTSDLQKWYAQQRKYYFDMLGSLTSELRQKLPGVIVSSPDASIYSVVDVRNIAKSGFNALDFVMWCATTGKVEIKGKQTTLLVSPMAGFYNLKDGKENPGKTQMRIAYVESPEDMKKVPTLFAKLFVQYESER
jgi:aspartate aminotransferase